MNSFPCFTYVFVCMSIYTIVHEQLCGWDYVYVDYLHLYYGIIIFITPNFYEFYLYDQF